MPTTCYHQLHKTSRGHHYGRCSVCDRVGDIGPVASEDRLVRASYGSPRWSDPAAVRALARLIEGGDIMLASESA